MAYPVGTVNNIAAFLPLGQAWGENRVAGEGSALEGLHSAQTAVHLLPQPTTNIWT